MSRAGTWSSRLKVVAEPLFYLCALGYVFFHLIPTIGGRIREKCYSSYHCSSLIRQGLFHYPIDLSDSQYRDFRSSIPLIVATSVGSMGLQSLVLWMFTHCRGLEPGQPGQPRQRVLAMYHLIFGLIFLFIQHKYHICVVLTICLMTYALVLVSTATQYPLTLIWIYGVFIMLFKECYRFKHLRYMFPLVDAIFDKNRYGGMYPWQFSANFLILRIISFSADYIRCLRGDGNGNGNWNGNQKTPEKLKVIEKGKSKRRGGGSINIEDCDILEDLTLSIEDYDLVNMLAYLVYSPLYIAGPIMSFNDFVKYMRKPQQVESVMVYIIRWCGAFIVMEIMCSYFPFFAVLNSGLFRVLSASEIAVVSYMTLKMMWLKFLLIWRLFRMWALFDGVAPPENMLKCMSNNYSLEGFWRGWHASFNKWILSYMYLPMGGKAHKIWSVWVIFLFVAIWHDLEFKLVAWGVLNSVFLVIEVVSRRVHALKGFQNLPTILKISIEVYSGATFIFVLIGVNMVGYAVGVTGTNDIVRVLLSTDGLKTVVVCYFFLIIGVCIMRYTERLRKNADVIWNVFEIEFKYLRTSEMGDKVNANDDGTDTEMRREKGEAITHKGSRSRSRSRSRSGRCSSRSKGGGGSRRRKKDE